MLSFTSHGTAAAAYFTIGFNYIPTFRTCKRWKVQKSILLTLIIYISVYIFMGASAGKIK